MKFIIAFACLLAVAAALPAGDDHGAHVLKQDQDVQPDGFHYEFETDNHIKASQKGSVADHDNWVVTGDYEFVDPHGQHIKVEYKADDHGYHPTVHFA